MQIALIENIQREDLNPIEIAECFSKMMLQFKMKHEDIAKITNKKILHYKYT